MGKPEEKIEELVQLIATERIKIIRHYENLIEYIKNLKDCQKRNLKELEILLKSLSIINYPKKKITFLINEVEKLREILYDLDRLSAFVKKEVKSLKEGLKYLEISLKNLRLSVEYGKYEWIYPSYEMKSKIYLDRANYYRSVSLEIFKEFFMYNEQTNSDFTKILENSKELLKNLEKFLSETTIKMSKKDFQKVEKEINKYLNKFLVLDVSESKRKEEKNKKDDFEIKFTISLAPLSEVPNLSFPIESLLKFKPLISEISKIFT